MNNCVWGKDAQKIQCMYWLIPHVTSLWQLPFIEHVLNYYLILNLWDEIH